MKVASVILEASMASEKFASTLASSATVAEPSVGAPSLKEAFGFASPPRSGFAFIAAAPERQRF
jgi:hypothetical protein